MCVIVLFFCIFLRMRVIYPTKWSKVSFEENPLIGRIFMAYIVVGFCSSTFIGTVCLALWMCFWNIFENYDFVCVCCVV